MIDIKIMGGLGNQLFQWACARNYQEKYGHFLRYDVSFFSQQSGDSLCHRQFALKKFPKINFNTKPEQVQAPVRTNIVDYFDYKKFVIPSNVDNWYTMIGYWQSEKYFKENEEIIRKELDFNEEIYYNITSKYPWITSEDTVSMHIRRTDYLTTGGVHPVQPISYYQDAVDLIGNKEKIVVFSDDIEWCKATLPFDNMVFAEGNDELIDLYLMSMCHDHIIANSSFSWWGAWLNSHKRKKVVAPAKWFGSGGMSYKDIVPETWTKL
jgi:hypothetical protein